MKDKTIDQEARELVEKAQKWIEPKFSEQGKLIQNAKVKLLAIEFAKLKYEYMSEIWKTINDKTNHLQQLIKAIEAL